MLTTRSTSIVRIGLCVLAIVSVIASTGCSSKNTNTLANMPAFSNADSETLTSAYTDYDSLKKNSSPESARQELVKKLNTEKGVARAYLGADGTSIFFTYDDGFLGIVDTYDPSESPPQTTSHFPSDESQGLLNVNAAKPGVGSSTAGSMNNAVYIANSRSERYQPPVWLADTQMTRNAPTVIPASKKVLVLQPICPGEKAYTTAASGLPAYFKANGWKDDDIDLKMNTGAVNEDSSPFSYAGDGSGLLVVKPEDYYDLGQYGVILFFGHGATGADVGDPQQFYLEFSNITYQTFRDNAQLRTWALNKQIAVGFLAEATNAKPNDNSTTIYRLFIRSDLLQQKMGKLPRSYVQLASCFGSGFQDIFVGNGAADFMSWDNQVDPVVADDNMKNMVKLMLAGMSASDSYSDSSVIKTDNDRQHWGADFAESMNPESNYYLPAWIKVNVTGLSQLSRINKGTSYIRVYVFDASGKLQANYGSNLSFGSSQVEMMLDTPSYLDGAKFSGGEGRVYPPGQYTIEVGGFNTDYDPSWLSLGSANANMKPGLNSIQVQAVNQKWANLVKGGPDGWVAGVSDATTTPTTTKVTPTNPTSTTPITTAPSSTTATTTTTKPPQTKLKELSFDDGSAEEWVSLGGKTAQYGFLVRLAADTPFAVTKIRINSYIKGTPAPGAQFTVRITDKDQKQLWELSLPMTLFSADPSWLEIQVPDIATNGAFCVGVYAPTLGQGLGPFVGVDETRPNLGSETISGWQVVPWVSPTPKETSNWLIRAVGFAIVP
jgi:hypothetical protein